MEMPIKHIVTSLILYLATQSSYAFFCPTNFTQINIGDSIAKVTAACGKPDTEDTKEVKDEGPQEWSYFLPQTISQYTTAQATGTLKTQIAFDASGKVLNINVNGIAVGSTTICNGATVSLGDTKESVKQSCGDPTLVNKEQENTNKTNELPPNKVTTYTYSNTNPPMKLIFENGRLVRKE